MAHLRLRFADVLKLGQIDGQGIIRHLLESIKVAVFTMAFMVRVEHKKLVFLTWAHLFEQLRRQDLVPAPSRQAKDGMPGSLEISLPGGINFNMHPSCVW